MLWTHCRDHSCKCMCTVLCSWDIIAQIACLCHAAPAMMNLYPPGTWSQNKPSYKLLWSWYFYQSNRKVADTIAIMHTTGSVRAHCSWYDCHIHNPGFFTPSPPEHPCHFHLTNKMSFVSSSFDWEVKTMCVFCFLHCKLINELKGTHTPEPSVPLLDIFPREMLELDKKYLFCLMCDWGGLKKNLTTYNKMMGE